MVNKNLLIGSFVLGGILFFSKKGNSLSDVPTELINTVDENNNPIQIEIPIYSGQKDEFGRTPWQFFHPVNDLAGGVVERCDDKTGQQLCWRVNGKIFKYTDLLFQLKLTYFQTGNRWITREQFTQYLQQIAANGGSSSGINWGKVGKTIVDVGKIVGKIFGIF